MELQGRTFSILGDSISTYLGYSNNTSYNTAIGGNAVAYGPSKMHVSQTWWYRLISCDGMRLCVNNSFSGACVGPSAEPGANTYLDRCLHLDNDTLHCAPDLIFVFMGANDYKNGDYPVGEFLPNSEPPSGTFACYYYRMIEKVKAKFPRARICLLSVLPNRFTERTRQDTEGHILKTYNAAIEETGNRFGADFIDLQHLTGITYRNCEQYYFDKLHPTAVGMERIYTSVSLYLHSH